MQYSSQAYSVCYDILSIIIIIMSTYHISTVIKWEYFLPKQSQKPISSYKKDQDHWDYLGRIHSKEGKILSYSRINMVHGIQISNQPKSSGNLTHCKLKTHFSAQPSLVIRT